MTDTPAGDRLIALDTLRGVAVAAILLLNAFSFTMPDAGYMNPAAYGGTEPIDLAAWAVSFVLVEGKMRALFSLLFGASLALVFDRTRAAGNDARSVHFRRLFWLLLFGLAHHLLIWEGDILAQYAIVGAAAYPFIRLSNRALFRWAAGFLTASFVMHAAIIGSIYGLKAAAAAPDATPKVRTSYARTIGALDQPGAPEIARDLAIHRASYPVIFKDRAEDMGGTIIGALMLFGSETLGLMLLGMLLIRNGFLAASWPPDRYRRWAIRAYAVGLPPTIALALWNWMSGFDALTVFGTFIAWVEPFRYAILIGHAALGLWLIEGFDGAALTARIAAVGRMAFTNYLLTSVIMTSLFYGYGGGLYGHVGRAQAYLFVFAVWAGMLIWSRPWLARYRYGPLEWGWRSLSRGERQAMAVRI